MYRLLVSVGLLLVIECSAMDKGKENYPPGYIQRLALTAQHISSQNPATEDPELEEFKNIEQHCNTITNSENTHEETNTQ